MSSPHALYRAPTPAELELLRLRDGLRALRRTLAAHEQALAELRAHLLSFEGRYLRQVGILYKKLDEWERKRAELHNQPVAPSAYDIPDDEPAPPQPAARPDELSLRTLFRELARRIHPDHATSAADELRRTRLMAQANDALQRRDRRMLERLLNGFEEARPATSIEAELEHTRALLRDVAADMDHVRREHDALATSELARLEAEVLAASRDGRDLLAETAARIQGRIGLAMRAYELDLDRIQRPPRGLRVEQVLSAEQAPTRQPRWDPKQNRWIR